MPALDQITLKGCSTTVRLMCDLVLAIVNPSYLNLPRSMKAVFPVMLFRPSKATVFWA